MIAEPFFLITWGGAIVIVACLILVVVKCIWMFGSPYAMLLSKEQRGWSIFPLVEFLPLLFALVISWLTAQSGWLSVGSLSKFGFGLILASYLHFCLVSIVAGLWLHMTGVNVENQDGDQR